MDEWLRQTWVHLVALLDHIVRMMYWVWIPGFLLSGFFSLRYHHAALEGLLKAPSGTWRAIAWATVFGMTCSANRRRSLQIATDLAHQGVHPPDILAFLVSSHSLVLYVLVLLMLLQGGEFAIGQLIGGSVMVGIVAIAVPLFLPAWINHSLRHSSPLVGEDTGGGGGRGNPATPRPTSAYWEQLARERSYRPATWGAMLGSRRGWWEVLKYIGHECRLAWFNFPVGLVLASLILTTALEDWWIDFHDVGGGRALTDLLNAVLGPVLAMVLCVPPVGNLLVGASLFKSYTFAYPGFVGFILAAVLHPFTLRFYSQMYGPGHARRMAAVLYGAAVLSGLVVTGFFALFGFRPGHVPLFRELVDTIMMWMPFAM